MRASINCSIVRCFNRDVQYYSFTSIILCFIFSIAANSKCIRVDARLQISYLHYIFIISKYCKKVVCVWKHIPVHRTCSSLQCLDQFVSDLYRQNVVLDVFVVFFSVFSQQFSKSKNYKSNQTRYKYKKENSQPIHITHVF